MSRTPPTDYLPTRPAVSRWLPLRGLQLHLHEWGRPQPGAPTMVMLHGWMDVGASFQFVVDALAALEGAGRHIVAPDWRGFGLTTGPRVDSYWFPDYLADLDALLRVLSPQAAVDLVGHSMGGNVAMSYAGVQPQRVRRLVNLEGFGLPATTPDEAPARLARWLDELQRPATLRSYADAAAVADRLCRTNPRLPADKARWLARQWARPGDDGRWHLLADPAHRRSNPVLYRVEEVLAAWAAIRAPVLWVEADATDLSTWWGHRYPRQEFQRRLAVVADCRQARLADAGHMLHHDQPRALAELLLDFTR
jgi:pimeloyl-ACP methyl ester carboxylesterase